MNKMMVENNRFIYTSPNESRVLLDCNDYLSNKSRVPMQAVEGEASIPTVILGLFREHLKLIEGIRTENEALEYLLMDVRLIAYLIQSPSPVRVLELGCTEGLLSYHLATILGKFNSDSTLCCVCDTIGNASGNQWLDRISLVETLPKLSMMATDYEDTHLAENHFDIVWLNGSVRFEQPDLVLKEAERVVRENGLIICYVKEQPLLESCFKLFFENREEYRLHVQSDIMVVKYNGKSV